MQEADRAGGVLIGFELSIQEKLILQFLYPGTGRDFYLFFAYNHFFPIHPHQENDAVEDVFKNVHVQEVKPGGMVFDAGNDKRDPENIEKVDYGQAQGDKPCFFHPGTA